MVSSPICTSVTQREMYAGLHRYAERWKRDHDFIPRRIDHAWQALQRWVDDGIVQERTVQVQVAPRWGQPATVREWRLTEQGADPILLAEDLAERDGDLARQESRARNSLQEETRAHAEAWQRLREVCAHLGQTADDPGDEEDIRGRVDEVARACNDVLRPLTHARMARTRLEQIQPEREALDALRARLAGARAPGDEDGDPLGGYA